MGEFRIQAWGRSRQILLFGARHESRAVAVAVVLAASSLCGLARAQSPAADPATAADPARDADSNLGETQPISLRYKFIEQYSDVLDPTHPELLTQYQVGSREKFKMMRERPQGAPERVETSLHTIYTERVGKLSPKKTASEVVRRYDKSQFNTTLSNRQYQKPGLLEDLSILYRLAPGKPVRVFNLSEGRRFRQFEFDRITRNPFLPLLAMYLPMQPRRVGDTWDVPRAMTSLLISEPLIDDPDYKVEGELVEVRGAAPGATNMTAVVSLKGQVVATEGPIAFNARVHFLFTPVTPAPAPAAPETASSGVPARKPREGIVEARGYISEIRLTEVRSVATGEGEGRLKKTTTRELVVARRISAGDTGGLPLAAPDAPADEPAYTWVTYDDPEGAFHVAHPQELHVNQSYAGGGVDLLGARPNGYDAVQLNLVPKTDDPAHDRLATDPMEQKKALMDQWKAEGMNVILGPSGWLKEPVWAQLNLKVYRIEAALKPEDADDPGGKVGRVYLDYYVVQFARNETLIVMATTTQDPHLQFRAQVETTIQKFLLGPSEGPAAVAAEPTAAPLPAGSQAPPR
ncbi:MAG: hypothetical protein P4L85_11805 [Paludisphaera borealis]|uniref:hypothetical protein n=1 Tax=Paludisphaera borealis TaxID=1387353 RepID=UPI00284019E9|nr:hypothetical protein [Paludisphaera borealis]MDR3620026.1 hypothetical protein [Paludisphaera borealis]